LDKISWRQVRNILSTGWQTQGYSREAPRAALNVQLLCGIELQGREGNLSDRKAVWQANKERPKARGPHARADGIIFAKETGEA
jgi:hypothetical protein